MVCGNSAGYQLPNPPKLPLDSANTQILTVGETSNRLFLEVPWRSNFSVASLRNEHEMNQPLFFDQLNIGDVWTSQRRTITEADVVNFAGLTGDYDPLHVDHEYAAETPFRRPIAHGLLGLAWVAGLASQAPRVSTIAFVGIRDWRFLKATFIGDTVHARTEVVDLVAKGRRRGQVIWRRQLINQHDEVVKTASLKRW